ncbi:hypothetical protein ScPMuIL_017578 [Solemya velum]
MLTEREHEECKKILYKLVDCDLCALCDTVTKKQIKADSKHEAISAILKYSESAFELLRRKKMARGYLFGYLADSGIVISVDAEKHQIIQRILEFWGSETDQDNLELGESSSSSSSSSLNVVCTANERESVISQPHRVAEVDLQSKQLNSLAETFLKWFYPLLNSNNPNFGQPTQEFGPHHFFDDATLHLSYKTSESNSESFKGSDLVSQRLLALVKEEMILFNPNISEDGVKCLSNPHGLVCIMTCGTVHRGNSCLGIFEQMFGLVRDPHFENNWKIKVSKLRMISGDVAENPRLCDTALAEMNALVPT